MKDESAAATLSAVCCARTMVTDTFRLGSIQHCLLQDALDMGGQRHVGAAQLGPLHVSRGCVPHLCLVGQGCRHADPSGEELTIKCRTSQK